MSYLARRREVAKSEKNVFLFLKVWYHSRQCKKKERWPKKFVDIDIDKANSQARGFLHEMGQGTICVGPR